MSIPSDNKNDPKRRLTKPLTGTEGLHSKPPTYTLADLYRALNDINKTILQLTDETELFARICQFAVDFIGVGTAWVSVAQPDTQHIIPSASYGVDIDRLASIPINLPVDAPEAHNPVLTAYRTGLPVMLNEGAQKHLVLEAQTADLTCASSASFPILRKGQAFAVLSVCHPEAHFFTSEIIALFYEITYDISFTLDRFDQQRLTALDPLMPNKQQLNPDHNTNKQSLIDGFLWRQANYDVLTKLPNRYMFQDRLEQEVCKALQQQSLLALLFIDLDHFKDVNDTLGYAVGDQLLIQVVARLKTCIDTGDILARMGGDEFAVILPKLNHTIEAEKAAARIISALAEPYTLNSKTVYVQASIGITFCPNDNNTAHQLIRNAEQAMYAAKTSGRNRLNYFTQALHHEAQYRLRLLSDMRLAIQKEQFELYFQPITNLASGQIEKAEALIRWNHPTLGIINPVHFIPLAEESGLIIKIGDWVFRKAAMLAKHWLDTLNLEIQISVNMSPIQFQSDALKIPDWLEYLRTLGLKAKHLSIEITEGLLLHANDNVTDKLLQFRDEGIQVAIDDFGIGYSALSYLRRFDIDLLKIDQFFIQNLESDQNNLILTEAIILMAHKLGLKVTAEGIETEAQLLLLKELNCDYGQGYLFSRPIPAAEFEAFLRNSKSLN